MKVYELTYIIAPGITSEEAEAKAKQIESLVQGREGIVLRHANPVAKTLAYPIRTSASGFLSVLEFEMEPEKLGELQIDLSKETQIIRKMVSIKKPLKALKQMRMRKPAETPELEKKKDIKVEKEKPSAKPLDEKGKIELEDIDKKLDELLGE